MKFSTIGGAYFIQELNSQESKTNIRFQNHFGESKHVYHHD